MNIPLLKREFLKNSSFFSRNRIRSIGIFRDINRYMLYYLSTVPQFSRRFRAAKAVRSNAFL